MKRTILLFGAGKSATVLIDYLLSRSDAGNWILEVADSNREAVLQKLRNHPNGKAVSFDIHDQDQRQKHIESATLVISLMPPTLHYLIAEDCLRFGKHLLTASYLDDKIRSLAPEVEKRNLLFLCEMGLDPGIDHMSACQIIHQIKDAGGHITSFLSHCGGLVAPEHDDNPWHYKISWNPRNVVNAGKAGAVFLKNGEIAELDYAALFEEKRIVNIPGKDSYCWYPNRDSLSYIPTYGLESCTDFIRTTLRHPDFMYGWKNIIDLRLTDEKQFYETDGKSLKAFFREHFSKNGFDNWLESKLAEQFGSTKGLLAELVNLVELEKKLTDEGQPLSEQMMLVDEEGDLKKVDIDDLKISAASTLAEKMHDASLTLKQLFFLGMDDQQTLINKGRCSAADVLQFALEQKLALKPLERDLVIMLHEFEYEIGGKRFQRRASLYVEGKDDQYTAMAATVGLPLGIAAALILDGTIQSRGVKIPVDAEIYQPVLKELEKLGIGFEESTEEIS